MFDERYEVFLADTDTARQIHHQVRYQVYCLDEGFEDPRNFSDGEEKDDWDEHSAHFLVRSKLSNEWVAAMRLVLPGPNGLPIEQVCDIDAAAVPIGASTAEISRVCIIDKYRRMATKERTHRSEIILGLLRAAVDYSYEKGISNWFSLSPPAIARIIKRLCIQLNKVGPPCDHRGVRYPFAANLRIAERQATEGSSTIAEWRNSAIKSYRRYSETELTAPKLDKGLVAYG